MGKEKKSRKKSSSSSTSRSSSERKPSKKDSKPQKSSNQNIDQQRIQADKETEKELNQIIQEPSVLIPGLRDEGSFLTKEYNRREMEKKMKEDTQVQPQPEAAAPAQKLRGDQPIGGRTGGVYVPPHKLAQLQKEMIESGEKNSVQHQKLMWELLRKSINGIINKVNIANIQNIIIELLNENILKGKGLLAKAIIKAQMASPNFTHVYAALIAVINTKLPDITDLIIRRVILQFQKAYKRNNKIVCMATTKMIAHLINQKVLSDFTGLQLLALMLENPTEDSVEIACDFMTECGQVLSELTPAGVNAIFERFKGILHEGEIDRRVQYSIESLFATRKSKFASHPGVIPELDLVEEEDQITHQISLDDDIVGEENLNIFKFDQFFDKTELEWNEIKKEILGEDNILKLKTLQPNELEEEKEEEEEEQKIEDLTEADRVHLKRTVYLTIVNSVDFEECAHKLLKMELGQGHEDEVCNMIIDCCMQERTYIRFYGLLSQRFCQLIEIYQQCYYKAFVERYTYIHRLETNKLRNVAKLFAHLLYTNSIEWRVLECIQLTQETTTASSRIFLKILFQELSENMGIEKLNAKLSDPELQDAFTGILPKDHPRNIRFAINFYTLIGLGGITVGMREQLKNLTASAIAIEEPEGAESESSSSESESESESSSDSDDESEDNRAAKKPQPKKAEIEKPRDIKKPEPVKPETSRRDDRRDDRRDEKREDRRDDRRDDRRYEKGDERRDVKRDEKRDDKRDDERDDRREEKRDDRKDYHREEKRDERRDVRKDEKKGERRETKKEPERDVRKDEKRDERREIKKESERVPESKPKAVPKKEEKRRSSSSSSSESSSGTSSGSSSGSSESRSRSRSKSQRKNKESDRRRDSGRDKRDERKEKDKERDRGRDDKSKRKGSESSSSSRSHERKRDDKKRR